MASFSTISPPLSPSILCTVEKMGFSHMTPVQASVIPLFMAKKDVCVEACTGSGKTLSFIIPVIEMLVRRDRPLRGEFIAGIIISPTRELAEQTMAVAQRFREFEPNVFFLLLSGGIDIQVNQKQLKKAQGQNHSIVLISTPGRLEDFLCLQDVPLIDASELEILILDEADMLLAMGFKQTIDNILSRLPKQRRTGLFSATQTKQVRELARAGLRNPAIVSVQVKQAPQASTNTSSSIQLTPLTLTNYYFCCEYHDRVAAVVEVIKSQAIMLNKKIIVFVATCASVDYFYEMLRRLLDDGDSNDDDDIPTNRKRKLTQLKFFNNIWNLHGKMETKKRKNNLSSFRSCRAGGVLITTDLTSRGIDIPDVDWIVQYDAPKDPDVFVHRVGRSARAGSFGSSIIFLSSKEMEYVELLRLKHVPLVSCSANDVCGLMAAAGDANQAGIGSLDSNSESYYNRAKSFVYQDRDLMDKATKCFVSFIRSYKEHHCQYIFQLKELDVCSVARSMVLARIPNMPDLKRLCARSMQDFVPDDSIDIHGVPYANKIREGARQARLTNSNQIHDTYEDGDECNDDDKCKSKRNKLRDKEKSLREYHKTRNKLRKSKNLQIISQWTQVSDEERDYKKMKKGKMSRQEFDAKYSGNNNDA